MNTADQARIQAYIDGELPPHEAHAVEALLQQDIEARTYHATTEATRAKIQQATGPSPDTEAEWQQVAERLEDETSNSVSEPEILPFPLKAITVAAAIIAGCLIGLQRTPPTASPKALTAGQPVELIDTTIPNASTVIYVDEPSGWTVVWVAEDPDVAESTI